MSLAGAGVKPGHTHGALDEFGVKAVNGRMHTNDLHAILLAIMGIGIALASFLQHSAIQLFCRQSWERQAVREEIRWLSSRPEKNRPG
ncbi:MAG: hypothetical protein JWM59_1164 [Verrucomicrobiales bacterium]|nr:hypothetical protein [Verrucomicrobiales bacterium]